MMDFTQHWHWPQWAVAILMLISLSIHASRHGDERLELSGQRKGKPELYNGFSAMIRFGLWIGLLICGGFFA